MSFITLFAGWITQGLRRQRGVQSGAPTGYAMDAAATVTFDSALQVSAVWACVKLLSETVASLPLTVYRLTDSGRVVDHGHAVHRLFAGKPNRYQTRVEFFESVMLNLYLYGNAYCQIERMGDTVSSLMPIMSSQVRTVLLADGSVVHEVYTDDGNVRVLSDRNVWHLKMLGNGIVGLSPLDYARNTIGIAQAAESAVTKIYRNGAKPSGVLTMDRVLTSAQREMIRSNFATLTTSDDDRLMVLEGGMKFDAVSLSPQDIELLASRRFQVEEICRWFGVPSVLINDTASSTVWGSGVQQIVEGFYKLTLRPVLEKIEASILANLLRPGEAIRRDVEFDFEALLRTDQRTRLEAYRIGVQGGILTPNEARLAEGRQALPGGDELYIQGANVPLTAQSEQPLVQ